MGELKVLRCCVVVKCEVSCSGMCQHRVWAFQGCSSTQWSEARKGPMGPGLGVHAYRRQGSRGKGLEVASGTQEITSSWPHGHCLALDFGE